MGLAEVTLHVGLDTFAPVTEDNADEHVIHTEWCEVTPETAAQINAAKAAGGRIIAVGTTSVRTLESAAQAAQAGQVVAPYQGSTGLFILPGYTFQSSGCHGHQFPPAEIIAYHAGQCVRRARTDTECLPDRRGDAIPLLLLRRCHVDFIEAE